MNAILISFKQVLKETAGDAMLFVVCFAPFLCGIVMKCGLPFIENLLTKYFGKPEIITPYYLLFDLMMAFLSAMLFCFVGAMVVLGEMDNNISRYLCVTPLGQRGYFISRFAIPCVLAMIVTGIVLTTFSLTPHSVFSTVIISVLASIIGMLIAFIIVALANNKVEGMAVSKLSGMLLFGAVAPFFVKGDMQYVFGLLPSFWLAKYVMTDGAIYIGITFCNTVLWIWFLYGKYKKKIA